MASAGAADNLQDVLQGDAQAQGRGGFPGAAEGAEYRLPRQEGAQEEDPGEGQEDHQVPALPGLERGRQEVRPAQDLARALQVHYTLYNRKQLDDSRAAKKNSAAVLDRLAEYEEVVEKNKEMEGMLTTALVHVLNPIEVPYIIMCWILYSDATVWTDV